MDSDKTNEAEDLRTEDRTVSELLHGLKRVDAPANFDSRVRSRIADGEAKTSAGWAGFPVPVYVASLAVLLLVGSLFLLREFYWNGKPDVPAVADVKKPPTAPKGTSMNSQPQPGSNSIPAPSNTSSAPEVAGSPTSILPFNKRNPNLDRLTPGGSKDSTLGSADPQNPRGFDLTGPKVSTTDPRGRSSIPVTMFLNALGIDAAFHGQELRITSVRGGSPADKSGVKSGDIIDAIGDTKITPTTSFGPRIEAKSITVIRAGQSIKIKFSIM